MSQKRLLFLHTGGTLGMTRRAEPGPLEPAEYAKDLLPYVAGLEGLASIEGRVIANLDSSDMTPALWESLAGCIAASIDDFDGFVVLHGTDTMAYTASALSFMLQGLPKPVVLTGSQRPIAELRTDARANLVHSALVATLDLPEVGLYFGRSLFRGNRATKVSVQDYDAFASPNFPPLLEMGVDVVLGAPPLRPEGPFHLRHGFSAEVAAIQLFPGMSPGMLERVAAAGARAVLLRGFGEGNLPTHGWPEVVRRVVETGVAVIVSSQCGRGTVNPGRYRNSALIHEAGAVFTGDMTIESALVKAMWLLGQNTPFPAFNDAFLRPVAGERSGC